MKTRTSLTLVAMILAGALSGSASAESAGWSVMPTPNPAARNAQLFGEACVTRSSCVSVGSYVARSGTGRTLVERSTSNGWRIESSPNPSGASVSELNGVSCVRSGVCVAAGDWFGPSGQHQPFAERLGRAGWRLQAIARPAGVVSSVLLGVSCASTRACTAVGYSATSSGQERPLAERWDGTRWRYQATPAPTGAGFAYLNGVSCPSQRTCVAVGAADAPALAERWNGSAWRIERLPTPSGAQFSFLNGVDCASADACTAVGASSDGPLVDHSTGTTWRIERSPAPSGAQFSALIGVSCASTSGCTAVGGYLDGNGDFLPLALGQRAGVWRLEHPANPAWASPGNYLYAVVCGTPAACTAVGVANGGGTPVAMAEHLTGSTWSSQPVRSPVGAAETQLNGVACPGLRDCLAVGTAGPTRRTTSAVGERLADGGWHLTPMPTVRGANLSAVACASTSFCIAAGNADAGTLIEQFNGKSWTIQPSPNPAGFSDFAGFGGVACTSPSFCMATGAYGLPSGNVHALTERWDGNRWTVLPTPDPRGAVQTFLGGVSCASATACATVGEQHDASGVAHTVALRWDGVRWHIEPTPNPSGVGFAALSGGVACTSPKSCLAAGTTDQGIFAERWNGTHWSLEQLPPAPAGQLTGISCTDGSACTAVGFAFNNLGGELLAERWNGTTWQPQVTPLLPGAHDISGPAVACPSRSTCEAVGGYENDGPGSHTLAEQWKGAGSLRTVASRAASLSVRPGACGLSTPLHTDVGRCSGPLAGRNELELGLTGR